MRMRKHILLFIIFFAALLQACTERIDLELDSTYTRLVVDGAITNQTGPHTIRLSYSADYFENTPPAMAKGAIVRLSDGTDNWTLTEINDGVYQTTEDFRGIIGKTYNLQINNVKIDNEMKSYTAGCELKQAPTIDSIHCVFESNWKFWVVNIYAQDPPTEDFYMFRVYNGSRLISDTINEVIVTDDRLFNGNYTYGIISQFFKESEAAEGDTITLEMASITKEYYNFIWTLQEETGYNDPLFDGPPANIIGNVSNGAIGFFAAYGVSYSSTVIR
jgi:hypothetical protein